MTTTPFALKRALRKVTQQRIHALPVQEIERQSQVVLDHLRESGVLDGARAVGCYLSMQQGELSTDGIVKYLLGRGTPLYVPIIPSLPAPTSIPHYAPPPPSHDMRMLRLYSTQDWEALKHDKWGIPDAGVERRDVQGSVAREDCMAEDDSQPPLDVILVPGVSFDTSFQRLGHGKGYYDRYIKRYRAYASDRGERPPLLVALSLVEQVLPFPPSAATASTQRPGTVSEREQLRARAAQLEAVPVTEDDERMDWLVTADRVWKRRYTEGE